jgi:hypothetical protein
MRRNTDTLERQSLALQNREIRPYFYYHELKRRGLTYITTICLLHTANDGFVARGISICSARDQFDKKKGRMIAQGRAQHALMEQENSSPIARCEVTEKIPRHDEYGKPIVTENTVFKCRYKPILNSSEKKLLKDILRKQEYNDLDNKYNFAPTGIEVSR